MLRPVRKYYPVDYRFEKTESVIEEFQEYVRKLENNNSLKIGFKIYNGTKQITLAEYLTDHSNAHGEFSVYFIDEKEFNTVREKLNHDIHLKTEWVGKFSLDEMQGCCGACVLFNSLISVDWRNKKIGHFFVKLQKAISCEKHYSILVCTDVITNEPQKRILDKFGFIPHFKFQNYKTKNLIEFRSTDLDDEKYYDVIWKEESLILQKFKRIKRLLKTIFTTIK